MSSEEFNKAAAAAGLEVRARTGELMTTTMIELLIEVGTRLKTLEAAIYERDRWPEVRSWSDVAESIKAHTGEYPDWYRPTFPPPAEGEKKAAAQEPQPSDPGRVNPVRLEE